MAMTSADTAQTPHPLPYDPCCARSINKQKNVMALSIDNLSSVVNDTVITSIGPSHAGVLENTMKVESYRCSITTIKS
jgi:hypothetical protein